MSDDDDGPDFSKELARVLRASPATAGEFLRAARIRGMEAFWAEIAWEACKTSLAGPPRLAKASPRAKAISSSLRGKGMEAVRDAADSLIQDWRDAGGTVMDIREALFRARTS